MRAKIALDVDFGITFREKDFVWASIGRRARDEVIADKVYERV